jgi:glycosyltransferase involved in cell wall biosynthesis
MSYNYQNIPNKTKRTIYSIIIGIYYILFKKRNTINQNIQFSIVGEVPEDYFTFIKRNKYEEKRYFAHRLSYGTAYVAYFHGEEFVENKLLNDDVILVGFPNNFSGIWMFFAYIAKIMPTVVRITDLVESSVMGYMLKKALDLKILAEVRGMNYIGDFVMRDTSTFFQYIRAKINIMLYSWTLRYSDIVTTTPVIATEATILRKRADVYTSDWLFLMGAIPMLDIFKEDDEYDNKYDHIVDNYEEKLFTFSRVEKGKQIKEVIDIFLSLQDKLKKPCLVIIGDGTYLKTLKNMYQDEKNIFFLGKLKREYAFPFIKNLDLFINPSGGYSLIEVGLLGVPSISFNIDIMSVLVYNRVNGYLVDPSTDKELYSAIIEYFDRPIEDTKRIKELCKETFRARFSENAIEVERLNYTNKIFGNIDYE